MPRSFCEVLHVKNLRSVTKSLAGSSTRCTTSRPTDTMSGHAYITYEQASSNYQWTDECKNNYHRWGDKWTTEISGVTVERKVDSITAVDIRVLRVNKQVL